MLDQLAKATVRAALSPTESRPLIPGALHLTYVQNTGGAFGLFQGSAVWLILVSFVVGAWILRELARAPAHRMTWTVFGWALILGGAIGNLMDRLRWGYVVDFLDLRVWPVFNVADSAITIGVGLILWTTLRSDRRAD